ncbi:hypothetical protein OG215_36785 (plasmid) [Streptomyces globisporus]|uniref:hypothetical protein n=1 Tax=Streptomyces globisporus TaxID=1908 RepID=UPI002F90CDBE|nr:hypothetical protein OG215_36785 [Streptomyces globisporus]
MATRPSADPKRGRKPAVQKAAAPPTSSEKVVEMARTKAEGIVADAETVAAAAIAEATEQAESVVNGLLNDAQKQADALRENAQSVADTLRSDAERDAAQLLDRARTDADELRASAASAAEETRSAAQDESDARITRATLDAERIIAEATEAGDRVRAEAKSSAEALIEHARGDAARLRADADAEAERLRQAGTADRDRAQDEAASIHAEGKRLLQHAQDTADTLRSQAEETASRVRTAAAAEATQLRKDATDDAQRTRITAEEEAVRLRTAARATVAEAEERAAEATTAAKGEADEILRRARAQAEGLTQKADAAFAAAETTLTEARGDAAVLRADAETDRAQAAEKLAQAMSRTARRLHKRNLKRESAETRRAAKRNEKEALRAGRPTWADKGRDALRFFAVRFLIIVPILAPMIVAWTGQSGFAMKVLSWNFAASLVYAAAYEMTTAYCAWLYDQARRDGDMGWEYRIATWLFGIGAAVQQWWHYSSDWSATPKAVTFSAMSMVGVVLWELFARLVHRRKLRQDRNLPPALPSLGMARWLRYPVRSWTARSLMIDNPDRWGNTTTSWTEAGRMLADRKARRSGKAYADLYILSVRRVGPDHGPGTIPAVHALMDRWSAAPAPDRTASGPDRTKTTDRGPDRTASGPDRTKTTDRGPDRTASGPDRTKTTDRGPDRTASGPDRTKSPTTWADHSADRAPQAGGPGRERHTDREPADRTTVRRLADGPPYQAPDGFELSETEQRAIDWLRDRNRSITRRSLGAAVRAENGSISSDRATEVARHFPRKLRTA